MGRAVPPRRPPGILGVLPGAVQVVVVALVDGLHLDERLRDRGDAVPALVEAAGPRLAPGAPAAPDEGHEPAQGALGHRRELPRPPGLLDLAERRVRARGRGLARVPRPAPDEVPDVGPGRLGPEGQAPEQDEDDRHARAAEPHGELGDAVRAVSMCVCVCV